MVMGRGSASPPLLLALLLLLAAAPRCRPAAGPPRQLRRAPAGARRPGSAPSYAASVQSFFDRLDDNRDGQLQEAELRRFVGSAELGPAGGVLDDAVAQITGRLDGADAGPDISIAELDHHLHGVLQGVKVADWVAHSLGLPQYAAAFRDNAVTVLDFPMLVNDGGRLLETELQVTRVLHRQRIVRAMQRQMLGLGSEPGAPGGLWCGSGGPRDGGAGHGPAGTGGAVAAAAAAIAAAAPGAVTCWWTPPAAPGEPPLHQYLLERFDLSQPAATWQPVAKLDDAAASRYVDPGTEPGRHYQYRVSAWNPYGRSPYALSGSVAVGGTGEGGEALCSATGGPHSGGQHLAWLQQQQQHMAVLPASGEGLDGLVRAMPGSDGGGSGAGAAAGASPQGGRQCPGDEALCSAGPQEGVLWFLPSQHDGSEAHMLAGSTPASAAVLMAHAQLLGGAKAATAAAAAAAPRGAGGQQGRGAGGGAARHVTHAAPAAGLAGSYVISWLRSCLHSLLLLVLPVCVRLLPVSVLSHVAAALARVLRLLPARAQQALLAAGPALPPRAVATSAAGGGVGRRDGSPAARRSSATAPGEEARDVAAVVALAAAAAAVAAVAGPQPPPAASDCDAAAGPERLRWRRQGEEELPPADSSMGQPSMGSLVAAAASAPLLVGATACRPSVGAPGASKLMHKSCSVLELRDLAASSASQDGDRWRGMEALWPPQAAGGGAAAPGRATSSGGGTAAWQQPGDVDVQQLSMQQLADALEQTRSKRRCAFPGCQQQFDLRHLRALMQRHYCGRCQAAYCLAHTAYSPHGPSGGCSAESRCVCVGCFYSFTPEYRALLSGRNTLAGKRSRSGPPRHAAAAAAATARDEGGRDASASAAKCTSQQQQQRRQQPQRPPPPQQHQQQLERGGAAAPAAGPQPPCAATGDASGDGGAPVGPRGAGLGRMLWGRGVTKASAVVRFQLAGTAAGQHRQHQQADRQGAAAGAPAEAPN